MAGTQRGKSPPRRLHFTRGSGRDLQQDIARSVPEGNDGRVVRSIG